VNKQDTNNDWLDEILTSNGGVCGHEYVHYKHGDTAEIKAKILAHLDSVIGEDEPTERPSPDFLIGEVYGVERNELRAELRKALGIEK
jgi:hypothetical protein